MPLSSKVLVWFITGCSSGSGFGASLSLIALEAGHKVVATSRNPSKSPNLVKKVEDLGGVWLQFDVNQEPARLQKVMNEVNQLFGPIDVLVNNAGISLVGGIEETRQEQ
jgi:NAD(P)-dependent dehydrogenase (short-subunit alcohol dehydrogenase family)